MVVKMDNYELENKIKHLAGYVNYEGTPVSDELIKEIIDEINYLESDVEWYREHSSY